ncbi:hypothetical protein ANN_12781 [Periplaneta americana]|uniref:Uncharacterized protein n=1 Tax=Periplaneta americana TaxID=6978 RepID=A0ABQ8TJP7_PERAM|nr:hypothetical protein ANN_12781 [Periplaneta americana]
MEALGVCIMSHNNLVSVVVIEDAGHTIQRLFLVKKLLYNKLSQSDTKTYQRKFGVLQSSRQEHNNGIDTKVENNEDHVTPASIVCLHCWQLLWTFGSDCNSHLVKSLRRKPNCMKHAITTALDANVVQVLKAVDHDHPPSLEEVEALRRCIRLKRAAENEPVPGPAQIIQSDDVVKKNVMFYLTMLAAAEVISTYLDVPEFCPAGVLLHASKATHMSLRLRIRSPLLLWLVLLSACAFQVSLLSKAIPKYVIIACLADGRVFQLKLQF